jgi:hypothetical protein
MLWTFWIFHTTYHIIKFKLSENHNSKWSFLVKPNNSTLVQANTTNLVFDSHGAWTKWWHWNLQYLHQHIEHWKILQFENKLRNKYHDPIIEDSLEVFKTRQWEMLTKIRGLHHIHPWLDNFALRITY